LSLSERPDHKVQSIQLLRALAASVVAVAHLAYAYADHVAPGLGLPPSDGQAGQAAVALFFLISGYIMVVSSAPLFGAPAAARRFWLRRAIRIAPPYWLATGLLLAVMLWQGSAVDLGALWRSLALVPYYGEAGRPPIPLLWPGWSLFYEAVFYACFGLGLGLGKWRAVLIAATMLVALVAVGVLVGPTSAPIFSLTRPLLLLFIPGMALALWTGRGGVVPPIVRLALALLVLPALLFVPMPASEAQLSFAYLVWVATPALLLFVAIVGGPLPLPALLARPVEALGDASYAIYLLHLPVATAWPLLYPGPLYGLGPWFYLATLAGGTLVVSLAFYRLVERPMTLALNGALNRRLANAK
jgi:exopolysaccharide production protein ExoZ